jgi:hypothetical protein
MGNPEQGKRRGLWRSLADRLKRLFKRNPEQPEDPYAYVMAPKKPRTPNRSAAAVAELPEE